jgi:hypothetical protein
LVLRVRCAERGGRPGATEQANAIHECGIEAGAWEFLLESTPEQLAPVQKFFGIAAKLTIQDGRLVRRGTGD